MNIEYKIGSALQVTGLREDAQGECRREPYMKI